MKDSYQDKKSKNFLEFTNFYKYFIKNFSYTIKPLNKLKIKKKWKWEEEHNKAFKELKEKITSQLIFVLPIKEGKFRVETDILGYLIREVLS